MPARFNRPDLLEWIAEWRKGCGEAITRRRELFGLHRRELADMCSTTEATIIRIESGALAPKDELRMVIAAVLRCEVADLWRYPTCEQINDRALAEWEVAS